MALVEVRDLVKVYGKDVTAVDGISFDVSEGEVFGFLGPNGAGKTTTIRVLVTRLEPTSGSARVDGIDVTADADAVRRRIGYAAQFIGIDSDLTGRENLVLQGRLHGMDKAAAVAKADELLEVIDLTEAADRRAGTFSGGMRRRLDLAQALVHEPRLLFLDEPTTGLDPQTRNGMWDYLRQLNERGVTIFLTTQYLEEADELAHRVAIIDRGRIVAAGTPQQLKAEVGGDAVTVTLHGDEPVDRVQEVAGILRQFSGGDDVTVVDHSLTMYLADGGSRIAELVRVLDSYSIDVAKLEIGEPTLDEVFLRHTGERIRVEEVKQQRRIGMMARRRRP